MMVNPVDAKSAAVVTGTCQGIGGDGSERRFASADENIRPTASNRRRRQIRRLEEMRK
jgi:hypothetical protein